MIKVKLKYPFCLDSTITCGQIFRYKKKDNGYIIILNDRVVYVYADKYYLYASSNLEKDLKEVIINYFDLENNYLSINDYLLKNDEKLHDSIIFSNGLTMIKQDPFETIIEYIISANNSIPSITKSLDLIASKYGKKVIFNDEEYYLFPNYKDLKDIKEEDLRLCKVGFRDKYLKSMIDKLNNNEIDLNEFYKLSTDNALNKLMENIGIGPKVASCILLFAYQKYDVFPVDTWVKKIMNEVYGLKTQKEIIDFSSQKYGKYCGIAIQYLFNYRRNK